MIFTTKHFYHYSLELIFGPLPMTNNICRISDINNDQEHFESQQLQLWDYFPILKPHNIVALAPIEADFFTSALI